MTRNSKKLQKRSNQEQKENVPADALPKAPPQKPEKEGNPFGISFVVPTETVKLPLRGEFYPESSTLYGVKELEIRHMTAKDEDLLSGVDDAESGKTVFDKLVESLLVDKTINSLDLHEEDKKALLLSARMTGYGPEYETREICQACNNLVMFSYNLEKIQFLEQENEKMASTYDPSRDVYKTKLPLTGIDVELKNFRTEDEEYLEEEKKQKTKYNLHFNNTVSYLERVIVSANGVTDRQAIRQLIDVLPAGDSKNIKSFYETCTPKLSTKQDVKCPQCGNSSQKEAPLSWAFFRTDV